MVGRGIAFLLLMLPAWARAESHDSTIRPAIDKGLRRLEAGAASYVKNRQCFSCHHQAVSIASLRSAQIRGFAVDADGLKKQLEFTLATFRPKLGRIAKGEAMPGASTMAAYALFALEAGEHPADSVTEAIVDYLLSRQKSNGAWPALMDRPPSEGSSFTNNGLALGALRKFATSTQREKVEIARRNGLAWLLKNEPATTEDKVFRLRGLIAGEADAKDVNAARDVLLDEQRPDGSWAQLSDRPGDAYATSTALMSLRRAGVGVEATAFRKGIGYLLRAQKDDGSWLVETRSRPVQIYFDNGDPGGKSQFISFAATGWAVLALLETQRRTK